MNLTLESMQTEEEKILKQVFGFDNFRYNQKDVINSILKKRDSVVIMPTGAGKSLCYQLPALIFEGLTVVISPLIALMKDQVEQLRELGISTNLLNSSLDLEQYHENISDIKSGRIKILYLAPESLVKPLITELLSSIRVDSLVIDEAHCISKWGHDFRSEYRSIARVRKLLDGAVCTAFTATATERVKKDIVENLQLIEPDHFTSSFDRNNLLLRIEAKTNPINQCLTFLKTHSKESGIIYCFSRRQTEELYVKLHNSGYSVLPYHAGLSSEERNKNQELFINDDVQIMVATVAFGMGINKSNIRFIIHYDLPKDIESYYQEIGRAGRDLLPAECLLLFSYGDVQKISYFINQKIDEDEKRIAKIHLDALLGFIETGLCRRIPLLNYFSEEYRLENCGMCDNCLKTESEMVDVTIAAQKYLSCIIKSGENFGMNHIIDILRGSKSQKIIRFGHDNISTHGIGKDISKAGWMSLARQFISGRLIKQDIDNFGILKLTREGYKVLKGEQTVQAKVEEKTSVEMSKESNIEYDINLFQILQAKRKVLAEAEDLPPYIIFSDRALSEMAAYLPGSLQAFSQINGVGEIKLKKYGELFIELITDYCKEHNLHEIVRPSAPDKIHTSIKPKYIITAEEYNAGKSVDELAENFSIKKRTLLSHLFRYLREGHSIRTDGLLTISHLADPERQKVLDAFKELGSERLKPVFEKMNKTVSYDEIEILRLYYLSEMS